jgi:hypothetical protein
MRSWRHLVVFAFLLRAGQAWSQAPVITPAGDPSVRSDSIYRLAVNPGDYPDEPVVLLLDDGVVRREADGTGVTTYRPAINGSRSTGSGWFVPMGPW